MKTTKKIIHNHLLEAKEKKAKVLKENKVISNRFNIILENKNIKDVKNLEIISEQIINETFYLNSQGYNKELIQEGIFDFIGNIFGASPSGIWELIKSKLVSKLLERFNIDPNSFWATFVAEGVGNVQLSDVPKLLTDCTFTTRILSKTLTDTLIKKLTEKKDSKENMLAGVFRESLGIALEKSDIGQHIESGLANVVCSLIHGIGKNLEKFSDNVKQNIVTNGTNTPTPTN